MLLTNVLPIDIFFKRYQRDFVLYFIMIIMNQKINYPINPA